MDSARLSSPIDRGTSGAVAHVLPQARHPLAIYLYVLLAVGADLQMMRGARNSLACRRDREFFVAQMNGNHCPSPSCQFSKFIMARCILDFTVPGLRLVARAMSSIDMPYT